MCGSLLSKFLGSGNRVAPVNETAFKVPKRIRGKTKLADESTSICEFSPVSDLEKKKPDVASTGNLKEESETEKEAGILPESSPGQENDAEKKALDSAVAILSAQRPTVSSDDRAMQSAREILEAQMESAGPSSLTTIAYQPVSSTRSVLMAETSNAVAFEVLVEHRPTVRSTVRVPRRLSKLESLPRPSTKQVNAKLLAAEERKLRELEHVRARACSRAGGNRPHPAEAASKATVKKIASKQAAAERNRNEVMAKKKQSGRKSFRKRNKIAAAQESAKAELQSAIESKMERSGQRKAEKKQQQDNQKNVRDEHARKVRDNVSSCSVLLFASGYGRQRLRVNFHVFLL